MSRRLRPLFDSGRYILCPQFDRFQRGFCPLVSTRAHSNHTRGDRDKAYHILRHLLSGDGRRGGLYWESPFPGSHQRAGVIGGIEGGATTETPWL